MKKTEKKKLIARLKNHRHSLDELASINRIEPEELKDRITELRDDGIPVASKFTKDRGEVFYIDLRPQAGNIYMISGQDSKRRTMRFGAASDLHFASLFHLRLCLISKP